MLSELLLTLSMVVIAYSSGDKGTWSSMALVWCIWFLSDLILAVVACSAVGTGVYLYTLGHPHWWTAAEAQYPRLVLAAKCAWVQFEVLAGQVTWLGVLLARARQAVEWLQTTLGLDQVRPI
jgi:hypothetical protein